MEPANGEVLALALDSVAYQVKSGCSAVTLGDPLIISCLISSKVTLRLHTLMVVLGWKSTSSFTVNLASW